MRLWRTRPDGKIVCEEYLEDGFRIKYYEQSIGANGENVLSEVPTDCEEADLEMQRYVNCFARMAERDLNRI
jgi:hypothetical protein